MANELLEMLAGRADEDGSFEGFLHKLAAELGRSPSQLSRSLATLRLNNRIRVLRRGHGGNPTRLVVVDPTPLRSDGALRPTLADRLLEHFVRLSKDGVVEQPLVEVARELGVGPPSISRAMRQLIDDGRARVDQVGTKSRPTRIELIPTGEGGDVAGALRKEIGYISERRASMTRAGDTGDLRAEVAALKAQVDRLQKRLSRLERRKP